MMRNLGYAVSALGLLAFAAPMAANATGSSLSGTYTLALSIRASTAVSGASAITCDVNLDIETDAGDSIQESSAGTAVVSSGNTYSCKAIIPYLWQNLGATTGTITANYDIYINGTSQKRVRTTQLPTLSIPADGANTIQADGVHM
jgi:hypothetical protein